VGTPGHQFSKLYGGGTSPVLEYDKAVISAALDYLRKPHDKPIFLLVGTYGPHHTFVAPEDLYRKYLEVAPALRSQFGENSSIHSLLKSQRRDFEPELIHQLRAAYYGMVETLDRQIGYVHQAWANFLRTNDKKGLFCYLSDHGEQAGERGLWGKMSFYEESARIPFLFTGTGVQSGVCVSQPCSLMDLGPTLCEIAGAESPPEQDGESLRSILQNRTPDEERTIFSELLQSTESGYVPARMVRKGKWKYISYAGYENEDQLFNVESDVYEEQNCLLDFPEVADELREALTFEWDPEKIVSEHERREKHWQLLSKWGSAVDVPEPDRWPIPQSAWQLPKP
jgi:choline-sulfatase